MPKENASMHHSKIFLWLLIVLFAGAIFVLMFTYIALSAHLQQQAVVGAAFVKPKATQAVFLANGQVYFGSIVALTSESLILDDVFYLQAGSGIQTADTTETDAEALSLVKLGLSEVHGPEDRMVINRDQVLFWENLKKDSQVAEAIDSYDPNAVVEVVDDTATGATDTEATNTADGTTATDEAQ